MSSRSGCAARGWWTRWPSSSSAGCWTIPGASSPTRTPPSASPALAARLTKIGAERVFVLHWRGDDPADSIFLSQRDVRELQFAKASIATGWRSCCPSWGWRPSDITQVLLAGQLRGLPDAAERRADRARAHAGAAAHRLGRQRRRRGRQDRRPVAARTGRGRVDPARGRVRRALGARGLQRPASSTSWPFRDDRRPLSSPAGRSPSTCARSARRRGWDVDVVPSTRCCTTAPSRSPRPWLRLARARYDAVALAYADCGTDGALDALGLPRLAGSSCYDVFAGGRSSRPCWPRSPAPTS